MAPILLLPQLPLVFELLMTGSVHFGDVQCQLYTHMYDHMCTHTHTHAHTHTHTDLVSEVGRRNYDHSEPPKNEQRWKAIMKLQVYINPTPAKWQLCTWIHTNTYNRYTVHNVFSLMPIRNNYPKIQWWRSENYTTIEFQHRSHFWEIQVSWATGSQIFRS
jgi:hypothetical protein